MVYWVWTVAPEMATHQTVGIAGKRNPRAFPATDCVSGRKRPHELETNRVYCIDGHEGLKKLPDESVDCVVTSPPYWATRDYGVGKTNWQDGSECALGLEPGFELYIEHLCSIFDEIKRVLKPTGTLWVNMGDTYHHATKWTDSDQAPQAICRGNNRGYYSGRRPAQTLPEKCLMQIPARFATEMIRRGWTLRNDIVWHKPNHMPCSAKDRLACSWEHLFLLVQQRKYYFDLDAVRVPHKSVGGKLIRPGKHLRHRQSPRLDGRRMCPSKADPYFIHPLGKNPADVWDIATTPSDLGHFAMFPEKLIERPILAGCPEKVCKRCGIPKLSRLIAGARKATGDHDAGTKSTQIVFGCRCKRGFDPGVVLDPFMGTGTTAVVARRLGRLFIGFELNPEYVGMANQRLAEIGRADESNSKGGEAA